MVKRFLSLIIVLTMLCSVMPEAYAVEENIVGADVETVEVAETADRTEIGNEEVNPINEFDVDYDETQAELAVESTYYEEYGLYFDTQTGTITDCDTSISGKFVIPSEIDGIAVTSIGDRAFSWCNDLSSIVIGSSITSIGNSAFIGCNNLWSAVVSDSVTSIGNSAFEDCYNLRWVDIGNGVTSIGYSSFESCKYLNSVTIPESVTSIGSRAFYYCTGLDEVTIKGNASIGSSAFKNCLGLKKVIIGNEDEYTENGLINIGDGAFFDCSYLESVTIGYGVISIERDAFYNCNKLNDISLLGSVTSIGINAFDDCSNLTSVYITDLAAWCDMEFYINTNPLYYAKKLYINNELATDITIPDGVTSIGNCAFVNCVNLTSVTIPDSVTSIGNSAFVNCVNLTNVTIPDSVTSIGNSAFVGTSLYENEKNWDDDVLYINNCLIEAKDEIAGDYKVRQEAAIIADGAFEDCEDLQVITLPDSITSIGNRAFKGCSGLTSITLPNGITSIANSAFSGCNSLTSITLPDSITSIGSSAFYNCCDLISIIIPDGVRSIEDSTFYYCDNLTSVDIGDGVISVEHAFYGCNNVEKLIVGNGLTSLENLPISASLKEIEIGDGITSIEKDTFKKCDALESIAIGSGLTSIENLPIYSSALKEISVDENNAYYCVDDGVLYDKDKTTLIRCFTDKSKITISDTVITVDTGAFNECNNIKSISFGNRLTAIVNLPIYESTVQEINVEGNNPLYSSFDGVLYNKEQTEIICYPKAKTSVVLSDNITSFDEYMFRYNNLKSITIGAGLTSVYNLYLDGEELQEINVSDKNEKYSSYDGVLYNKEKTTLIRCPRTKTSIVVLDSTTSLKSDSFEDCDSISSITIGSGLTSVNYLPLYNDNIQEINVSANNTKYCVDDGVLYNKGKKTLLRCPVTKKSIIIPDTVTKIGNKAFLGCDDLTSVTIGTGISSIDNLPIYDLDLDNINISENNAEYCTDDGVLYNKDKSKLLRCPVTKTSIVIPNTVTEIDDNAFKNCTVLATINVDKNNSIYSSIDGILYNKGMTELLLYPAGRTQSEYIMPDCVNSIKNDAFIDCSFLENINVSENNTIYSSRDGVLFTKDMSQLIIYPIGKKNESFAIPNSVYWIGVSAFKDSKVNNILIPSGVTYIAENAFENAILLSDIYYGGKEKNWNNITLEDGNTYLKNATIHYGSDGTIKPEIDKNATIVTETKIDTYTFEVTLNNMDCVGNLVAVLYDEAGAVAGIKKVLVAPEDTTKTVIVTAKNANSAKIFLWSDIEEMKPLCGSVEMVMQ